MASGVVVLPAAGRGSEWHLWQGLYNRVSEAHHYSVSSGQPGFLISGQQPVLAAVGLACVAMKQMSLLDIPVLYTSMDKHADVTVYGLKARHPAHEHSAVETSDSPQI